MKNSFQRGKDYFCFSVGDKPALLKLELHENPPEGLLKPGSWAPPPGFLIRQVWAWASDCASLTGSCDAAASCVRTRFGVDHTFEWH